MAPSTPFERWAANRAGCTSGATERPAERLLARCREDPALLERIHSEKRPAELAPVDKQAVIAMVPRLVRNARASARQRAIPFGLSASDVLSLLAEADYRCALTGIAFSADRHQGAQARAFFPSIDRKDCALGYIRENCRVVCVAMNIALGAWGEAVFERLARGFLRR